MISRFTLTSYTIFYYRRRVVCNRFLVFFFIPWSLFLRRIFFCSSSNSNGRELGKFLRISCFMSFPTGFPDLYASRLVFWSFFRVDLIVLSRTEMLSLFISFNMLSTPRKSLLYRQLESIELFRRWLSLRMFLDRFASSKTASTCPSRLDFEYIRIIMSYVVAPGSCP